MGRSVVINRSPVMTAWAFVVSERLGFTRRESLSFASVCVLSCFSPPLP